MTLGVWNITSQIFCRMPHHWNVTNVLFMIILGLWINGRKPYRQSAIFITSYQVYINMIRTANIGLSHLAEIVSGLPIVNLLFVPLSILWKEVTVHSAHVRIGELCFPSLRMEYLYKLFEILLHGKFDYAPPFIIFLVIISV